MPMCRVSSSSRARSMRSRRTHCTGVQPASAAKRRERVRCDTPAWRASSDRPSGIGMDFGRGVEDVSESDAAAIHAAYRHGSMATALVDAIIRQALAKPTKAPLHSLADALVRERSEPPHTSRMESATAASRWGG
jgi:hypothetical protein